MNSPRRVERECCFCARKFKARVSDVNRGYGRLCSQRCVGMRRGKQNAPASHPAEPASHPRKVEEASDERSDD